MWSRGGILLLFVNFWIYFVRMFKQQVCIPIGCVKTAHWPYSLGGLGGGVGVAGGMPTWGRVCLPGGDSWGGGRLPSWVSAFLGYLPSWVGSALLGGLASWGGGGVCLARRVDPPVGQSTTHPKGGRPPPAQYDHVTSDAFWKEADHPLLDRQMPVKT